MAAVGDVLMSRRQQHEVAGTTVSDAVSVHSLYAFGAELGRGNYGVVRSCVALTEADGEIMACKTVLHSAVSSHGKISNTFREIKIMQCLPSHPSIIGIRGIHNDATGVHIVMELARGGELFDEVIKRGRFTEFDACATFRQLASAVEHCHRAGIVHRDIKLENILIGKPALPNHPVQIKLADFGLAVPLADGSFLNDMAGSPFYMSPEIVVGDSYDKKADVWSMGIVLFCLLSGLLPFTGPTNFDVFRAIKHAYIDLSTPAWAGVSKEAKRLVSRMLDPNPERRPSSFEVCLNPWVRQAMQPLRTTLPSPGKNIEVLYSPTPSIPHLPLQPHQMAADSTAERKFRHIRTSGTRAPSKPATPQPASPAAPSTPTAPSSPISVLDFFSFQKSPSSNGSGANFFSPTSQTTNPSSLSSPLSSLWGRRKKIPLLAPPPEPHSPRVH